ncbi:MAG: putative zinc-binding metallopeptidase [Phycisphaerales bacterium]
MPAPGRSRPPARSLASMSDEQVLAMRLRDLPVSVEGSELGGRVNALHAELDDAGVRLRPRVWLSDEWFAPKDGSGIAAPFCLAHPRLKRLERKMMFEVEGGTKHECMKILRHEAGHVVQFAFGLHRRRSWQRVFGRSSQAYPEAYTPRPYSRRYVLHIDSHYAQAHPDEDFAETFAVWLTPGSNWRSKYKGEGRLKKLEYVDGLMGELRGVRRRPRHAGAWTSCAPSATPSASTTSTASALRRRRPGVLHPRSATTLPRRRWTARPRRSCGASATRRCARCPSGPGNTSTRSTTCTRRICRSDEHDLRVGGETDLEACAGTSRSCSRCSR